MQGIEIVDKVRKGVSSYMWVDDDFFKTDRYLFDSIHVAKYSIDSVIRKNKVTWTLLKRPSIKIQTLDETAIELPKSTFAYFKDVGGLFKEPKITGLRVNIPRDDKEFVKNLETINDKIVDQKLLSYPPRRIYQKVGLIGSNKVVLPFTLGGIIAFVHLLENKGSDSALLESLLYTLGGATLGFAWEKGSEMLEIYFDNIRYNSIPQDARENYLFGQDAFDSIDKEVEKIVNNDKKIRAFNLYKNAFGEIISKNDFSTAYDILAKEKIGTSEKLFQVENIMDSPVRKSPSTRELRGLFKTYEEVNKSETYNSHP